MVDGNAKSMTAAIWAEPTNIGDRRLVKAEFAEIPVPPEDQKVRSTEPTSDSDGSGLRCEEANQALSRLARISEFFSFLALLSVYTV